MIDNIMAQPVIGGGRKKSQRQVNIELLRIVSMLLVLLGHYDTSIWGNPNHEMVMADSWRAVGVATLKSLDFICVNCFIIISGYFGIRWKLKSLCNYLFQISFWGGMVYLITFVLGMHDFSAMAMIKNMTMFLKGVNWFFITYLGLYMFAPILNAFIEKSTEKELGWMVLIFYAFQTVFGYVLKVCHEFDQGLTFVSFIGLYLLGAYLKRSSLSIFQWNARINLIVYLGVGAACVVASMTANYVGFEKDLYSYISPWQIVQTIYLFLCCKALNVGERWNDLILFFSSSAFAGLLMHSWEGGALYGRCQIWITHNLQYPVLWSFGFIIFFFATACCIDKFRLYIWNNVLAKRFFSINDRY